MTQRPGLRSSKGGWYLGRMAPTNPRGLHTSDPAGALSCRPRHSAGCGSSDDAGMERPDLLLGFLAFGAAVMTLWAWLWSSLSKGDS